MSKLVKLLVATCVMAMMMALGASSAIAAPGGGGGGGGGNGGNACPEPSPGFPDSPIPGCGQLRGGDGTCTDGLDNDGDGPRDRGDSECRDPNDQCENGAPGCPEEDGDGAACPPATGPISGVVQQVSDGIRDGGGGALADVIDQVNCGVVVPIEDALGLSAAAMGA